MGLWAPFISMLRFVICCVCTGDRFQSRGTKCRFGCGGMGSVSHFVECSMLEGVIGAMGRKLKVGARMTVGGRICAKSVLLHGTDGAGGADIERMTFTECIIPSHCAARLRYWAHRGVAGCCDVGEDEEHQGSAEEAGNCSGGAAVLTMYWLRPHFVGTAWHRFSFFSVEIYHARKSRAPWFSGRPQTASHGG